MPFYDCTLSDDMYPQYWTTGIGGTYQSTGLFASVGSTYDYIATAYNGWLAIMTENGIGWVSGTCAAKEAKKNA